MLGQGWSSTGRDHAARGLPPMTARKGKPRLAYAEDPLAEGKFHLKGECLYEGDMRLDRLCDMTRVVDGALRGGEFREAWNGL